MTQATIPRWPARASAAIAILAALIVGSYGCLAPAKASSRPHELTTTFKVGIAEVATAAPKPAATGKLEIHVIDVGQGDAIWIRCPHGNHEMLIDSGDTRYPGSSKGFKKYLTAHQAADDPIEVAVASHPHSDHIGNMAWVLDHFTVNEFLDDGVKNTTNVYKTLMADLTAKHVPHLSAQTVPAPAIDFCPDVNVVILQPAHFGKEKNPNNNSVAIRLQYQQCSFLFVGDAEDEEEQMLLGDATTNAMLPSTFLKAPHHGSDTSSSQAFLDQVRPQTIAVSCGEKEIGTNFGYKHPRKSTIDRFLVMAGPREGANEKADVYDADDEDWKQVTLNKAVYLTSVDGDVVFECDGTKIHRRP